MRANYKSETVNDWRFSSVIEVLNYPIQNRVVNLPRISRAEFLTQEDRKKEEYIKGYWKIKQLKTK